MLKYQRASDNITVSVLIGSISCQYITHQWVWIQTLAFCSHQNSWHCHTHRLSRIPFPLHHACWWVKLYPHDIPIVIPIISIIYPPNITIGSPWLLDYTELHIIGGFIPTAYIPTTFPLYQPENPLLGKVPFFRRLNPNCGGSNPIKTHIIMSPLYHHLW